MYARKWTEEELDTLRQNYGKMTARELAQMLGRTQKAISCKAHELGITEKATQCRTIDRKEFVKLYPHIGNKTLAIYFGISLGGLRSKACRLGIKKSETYKAESRETTLRKNRERYAKWSRENPEKVKANRMKWKERNLEYYREYNREYQRKKRAISRERRLELIENKD